MNKLTAGLIAVLVILTPFIGIAQSGEIDNEALIKIKQSVWDTPDDRAIMNAITNNDINNLAQSRAVEGKLNGLFSNKVKTSGITDQKSTGRCWLFTGLNTLKPIVLEKLNLNNFEFSQNYNFFWDQLEKSNLFLEAIIATRDLPSNNRTVEWLFKNPIQDGGQWTTFADNVKKYGAVPKDVMPETFQSENTNRMRNLLSQKLLKAALEIRKMTLEGKTENELRDHKINALADIYRILALSLGEPPAEFSWQYEDKDGAIKTINSITPLGFFNEYAGINPDDYVMFMNDPTREYGKLYEIEYDRSMTEGYNWKYINLENEKIREFAKASILDNQAMYFSCDVGKQLNKDLGTLDLDNYDYNDLMGVDFNMNKAERISTFSSASTHGMALVGVNITAGGTIDKWLLENSWGSKSGHNGYLIMTNEWFDEYMFRIIINKKFVDGKTLEILKQESLKLPPWDPMFASEL